MYIQYTREERMIYNYRIYVDLTTLAKVLEIGHCWDFMHIIIRRWRGEVWFAEALGKSK